MSGYGSSARKYAERGWAALPLPHNRKKSPPEGWTGITAPMPSLEQIDQWALDNPDGNVALRLPDRVIGIDVDAYKGGGDTMRDLTAALGELPPTWRSSARSDGLSGIYFYRVPDGTSALMGDVGPNVETIRHNHRYAVVAPSLHPETGTTYGWYAPDGGFKAPWVSELPELPLAWVEHLISARKATKDRHADYSDADAVTYNELEPAEKARIDAYLATTVNAIRNDLVESATWETGRQDSRGRGWEKLQADKAWRLAALAKADWNPLTMDEAREIFLEAAPRGGGWGDYDVQAKWDSQQPRAHADTFPEAKPKLDLMAGLGGPPTAPAAQQAMPSSQEVVSGRYDLDVSNPAKTHAWLLENLGRGPLSGIFSRANDIVFTPRIGHEGYIEPRVGQPEDAAAIVVLDAPGLAARIQSRYETYKMSQITDKDSGETRTVRTAALFPLTPALFAVKAPDDARGLRQLHGIVHTPTFRADGSLLSTPGYDEETGLLFLPTGGQPVAAIPEHPTAEQVTLAMSWIDYMLQDFVFVSDDDRTNYIGLMLTPLLRAITPAPYKLGVIEAHQPGSGKTYLARALMSIHSGIMHSELPSEEAELVKTITSILDTSTGMVCVFDNVTGVVRSSALAGLLTNPTYQGRRLGTGKLVDTVNDRLWVITGNNAALGGDLARRSLRVKLDPGVPNPEQRTEFVIPDFENWVREHRGDLLWSLLTLVRHWVVVGSPVPDKIRADSYGKWSAVVASVIAAAGVPGTFDDPKASQPSDPDHEEWAGFFAAVYALHGSRPWNVKTLLKQVAPLGFDSLPSAAQGFPLSFDILPASLLGSRETVAPISLTRTLGRFLLNREGRWFGELSVRQMPTRDSSNSTQWYVESHSV